MIILVVGVSTVYGYCRLGFLQFMDIGDCKYICWRLLEGSFVEITLRKYTPNIILELKRGYTEGGWGYRAPDLDITMYSSCAPMVDRGID